MLLQLPDGDQGSEEEEEFEYAEEDPDAPFDINGAARSKGVELPKLPGLPDFTLPKLGNDLREIEIPDAVADKVGAKETGQLIDLLPWNRPDYPLKPKKGSGL